VIEGEELIWYRLLAIVGLAVVIYIIYNLVW
jgi:hypothetical protein